MVPDYAFTAGTIAFAGVGIGALARRATEARCTATARMNNASVVSMNYRFFIEAGQLLIEDRGSPLSGG
ncbi:hypothetical protein GGD66_006986 [Bradyrhizobium sp. CIR48]|uniref:hypothetical protein n=1 Tax=Bradyrhizobium sp. CIR48 TaxID=2663840 RepID=UPI001606C1D2|nr:hypothetical protein [Bradyrhizobium sp. CIR48]MBB4428399.1 hypothetical protein [Bradyrhizobium sp. CIR48]